MELEGNLNLLPNCALDLSAGPSNPGSHSAPSLVLSSSQRLVETPPSAAGEARPAEEYENTSEEHLLSIDAVPGTRHSVATVQRLLLSPCFTNGKTEASNAGLFGQSL